MKKITLFFAIASLVLVSACSQEPKENSTAKDSPQNSLKVAGLTFSLPSDWKLRRKVSDSEVLITVPDEKYVVAIPMKVAESSHRVDENDRLVKETPSGAKIYYLACAPAISCYYVAYRYQNYEITFEVPKSNEPVPKDLDGPWYPKTSVTEADTLKFLATIE